MTNISIIIKQLTIVLASVVIFGCASDPDIEIQPVEYVYNMNFDEELIGSIGVFYVHEPDSTSELQTMGVTGSKFKTALHKSLKLQHLLAIEASPRHRLTVSFIEADQANSDSDLYFESRIRYVLVDSSSNEVVFNSVIVSKGEASSADSLISSNRYRSAVKRSVDQNIRDFLSELSSNPVL